MGNGLGSFIHHIGLDGSMDAEGARGDLNRYRVVVIRRRGGGEGGRTQNN